jgi:CBS domain-containing protein
MKVNEIMTADVAVIRPDASIVEAARQLDSLGVGSLPVCNGDRLVGMITDRDIAIRVVAKGRVPAETKVEECMTKKVIWCFDDETLEDAQARMQANQVRRLPVISREKRLVGILAIGDLATKTDAVTEVGETVREISELAPA